VSVGGHAGHSDLCCSDCGVALPVAYRAAAGDVAAIRARRALDRPYSRPCPSRRFTSDQAYDLVMKVAAGELDQAEEITAVLQGAAAPRN
jgi:hypothetical protein